MRQMEFRLWRRLVSAGAVLVITVGFCLVLSAPVLADATAVTLTLVDEVGSPLASYPSDYPSEQRNLQYRYRYGGTWADWVSIQTDANGQFLVTIDPAHVAKWDKKVTVRLNQNSKEQDVTVNPVFQAARADVTLKTCDGPITDVPGGAVHQGGGYWYKHGDTGPSGTVTFHTFPGTIKVRMTYAGASEQKSQDIATNATNVTVVFQTALVTMKLLDSDNNELGGGAQYYASGWKTFGNGTTTTSMELLPLSYSFRVSYVGASQEKSQNTATNSTVVFWFSTWYRDADGDDYGDVNNSTQAFSQPQGYVSDSTDCDDNDNTIYPGASELADGKDNDCDGSVDEGVTTYTWYRDADGDGYGNPAVTTQNCTQPSGYVSDSSDCNDNDNSIYPGAPELADGKDNDCDGSIDEGTWSTLIGSIKWYILVIQSTPGGTVTEPTAGNFPYGAGDFFSYYPDTVVDLVAVPDAGYRFVGWTGGPGIIADASAAATTITMNRDCAIRANFAKIPETPQILQYDLSISSGAGGSVTVPGEGTFACDAGTVLDLVAKADSGYRFVNWTGDVTTIANVNGASTTITMNDDYSVVANFAEIPPNQFTLTVSSTDGGSVTTPGEATFTYDEGTVVNLKAEPEEGYRFVMWIGDVDDIADVTAASTTITMNDDCSIIATFKFGTGCFIATAAYGTPMAEEIGILREFRDQYLITNPMGSTLVDIYYRVSPPIADFITEHPSLRPVVRVGLAPAVAMSTVAVNTSLAQKAAILGLSVLISVALAIWATRRRGKSPQYV